MRCSALLTLVVGSAFLAPPAVAYEPARSRAEACHTMWRAGVIPAGEPALVLDHPDGLGMAFVCVPHIRAPGPLLPRYALPPQHEDEPRLVVVLGAGGGPAGCGGDDECLALLGQSAR